MGTPDSMDALFSMVGGYVKEEEFLEGFENMEEEEEGGGGHVAVEKKRRLSVQQVRSLEKLFEVENKLEPQRKMELAKELGLQPRQVAVWFQNRRARWKTKQLEKEYGLLKLNFNSLKSSFDNMQRDNHKLVAEVASLKRRWEETQKQKAELPIKKSNIVTAADSKQLISPRFSDQESGFLESNGARVLNETLEGSESDSSAILNDSYIHSLSLKHCTLYVHPSDYNDIKNSGEDLNNYHNPSKLPLSSSSSSEYNQQQYSFKVDYNEESCSFFTVDDPAAATLPWWE